MKLIYFLLEVVQAFSLSGLLFRGKFSYIYPRKNLRQVAPNLILFSEDLRIVIDILQKYPVWFSLAQVSRDVFRKNIWGRSKPPVVHRWCWDFVRSEIYSRAPNPKIFLRVNWINHVTSKRYFLYLRLGASLCTMKHLTSQHHWWF